jgi:hypothetical protein
MVNQELKLGRTDQRVATHLFAPFMEGIASFLKENGEDACKAETPIIKKEGDDVLGVYHCQFVINIGSLKSRFALSFDNEILDWFRFHVFSAQRVQLGHLTPEIAARLATNAIFEVVAKLIEKEKGVQVRLLGNSIVCAKQLSEFREIISSQGVMIPLRTSKGRIVLEAFVKPKTALRAAAGV